MPFLNIPTLLCFMIVFSGILAAQERGIEFVSGPKFELSESATAAGIDGSFTVSLKVDRTGRVNHVDIVAGPVWPCGTNPRSEIKMVRDAVKENILASQFSPATKGGQPVDGEATLDFAIGDAYREALSGQTTSKSKWIVDAASVPEQKPTSLPVPPFFGYVGTVVVRIIIGEDGHVIAAGAIRGNSALHAASRYTACDSKFPPTIVAGKPVKVSGLIYYEFTRWRTVTARFGSK